MAKRERWYFTKEELESSPSRRCGIDPEKELGYRQQAANLIQDMGQKLKVTQLVINTAIVYMHRFYTFHSFTKFHRNAIAACALFLAAKVEEQPRKLEHVIRVWQICIFRENMDIKSEQYQRLSSELVYNENLMLRTLGFELNVQHPHTSIVNCCQLVRATKYIAETSYYLATNSLHLSTLCLQYKPTVVACICIYFVCKWSNFQFAKSTEGKDWWSYVDQTVNKDMLEELMSECVAIFQKCPQRLKKCLSASKINSKLPNNPLLKQIEDLNKLNERPALDDHVKQTPKDTSKANMLDSRQMQSKTMLSQNTFNDHSKKESSLKGELSQTDSLATRLAAKHVHNHQSGSSSNLFSKENSPFSHLPPSNSASKNSVSKELAPIEDRLKGKDSVSNSSFFDAMKSNLSVIPPNPLGNSAPSNAFNESLDSHSLFSNDTSDLTEFTLAHKKDFMPDLKMEFSDNEDSNPSDNNITFASTLMMNDSNDSKSLSHAFSNRPNFEPSQSYDFKLKANSFGQFSSQDLQNSGKSETKIDSNHGPINSLFQTTDSKFINQPPISNNVLPNSLLFPSQLTPATLQPELPYLDNFESNNSVNEKAVPSNQKASSVFANKKAEVPKSNISNDAFGLGNANTFNSATEATPNPAPPSASSKSVAPLAKQLHENSKPFFNQTLTYNNNLEPETSTDHDDAFALNAESESDHSRKSKHKSKKKHKEHKKHKEKHKHKRKHKEKEKSSFQVITSPSQHEKLAPIKLKISKAMLEPASNASVEEKKPLKLKIQLSKSSHQRSSSESPSNTDVVGPRKRKHEHSDHGSKFSKK